MRTSVFRRAACLVFCLAALSSTTALAQNYSDIWWNPNGSGWGLTLVDHDTQLAAVWYTYDLNERPVWYVMPAEAFSPDKRFATLDIYRTAGPAYNVNFNPDQVASTKVGTATFDLVMVIGDGG
jgi:hypothetical protein